MSRHLAVVVIVVAACGHPRVERCDDDLHGVWVAPAGRWMMLDNRATLEAYPLAADLVTASDMTGAPRALDLTRSAARLEGELHRRYTRGAEICEARAPVHVTACRDDTLEIVRSEPAAPLAFGPCRWPVLEPARVERWRRE